MVILKTHFHAHNREFSFECNFREPESRSFTLRFNDAMGFSKTFGKDKMLLKIFVFSVNFLGVKFMFIKKYRLLITWISIAISVLQCKALEEEYIARETVRERVSSQKAVDSMKYVTVAVWTAGGAYLGGPAGAVVGALGGMAYDHVVSQYCFTPIASEQDKQYVAYLDARDNQKK